MITMSLINANVAPSPIAGPFTAAIRLGTSRNSRTILLTSPIDLALDHGSAVRVCSMSSMSPPPAQKIRPAPVITTAPTSGWSGSHRRNARISFGYQAIDRVGPIGSIKGERQNTVGG